MIKDNPAARLHEILKQGQEFPTSTPTKDAWSELLNIDDQGVGQESILMSKLSQFVLLPYEVEELISLYYPEQSDNLRYAMNKLHQAILKQNLSGSWSSFSGHIDQHSLSTLSMAAALLEHKLDTKLIDADELSEFKVRIQTVLDESIDSNLSTEFKKYVTHYLQKILTAINDYMISGAQPILDALEATLGHAVLDPEFKEDLKKTETGSKIRDILGDLANVVTIATAASGAVAYLSSNGVPLLN
ncbi:hypothetical protein L1D55_14240 [Vibrio sp. Isolate22]|uniref:Uncharacterized protein n=1 Tax=Vibrio sp. FF_307 TaxID=1652834 RepID=A0A0H3ZSD1_9VIBR|nr:MULTISPECIES: hypothetical protein [Vibrio]AKN36789.1 hypothetical protein [Vibrio sp. FF_307]MCG9692885.1 hypothetical protein [Vibrio sp. Isolate22]TKF00265.1 hypothetical protein FCV44_04150 [Vibrio kanaloae]TKF17808.1 hypothetical protein FCV47_07275 [Vibrio kanaloae]TKF78943.1 hypothetical protein FCV62_10510 [Vibrio kanaloae]